jgi:LmbE family N-acetylglucosaminyl deacetylase
MTLQSAVCFFAHPDDETILAGGIVALLARQGVHVQVVCATRGEGGELGEPPVVPNRDFLGAAREAELRCAVHTLGATATVLGYVDPTVGAGDALYPFAVEFDALAAQFGDIARRYHADLVLTHGADGEYGHPAHQLVHRAVRAGVPVAMPETLIYTVAACVPSIEDRLWNQSEPAHLALDIQPWGAVKVGAMLCHVSQHALFKRRRGLRTVPEALRTTESVRRAWPDTDGKPPQDAFADLLREAGAWRME